MSAPNNNVDFTGLISSGIAISGVYPIETLRTKAQVTTKTHTIKRLLKETKFLGLYSGFNPNLIAYTSFWGVYYGLYSYGRRQLESNEETRNFAVPLAAMGAASVASFSTNPIWIVRDRLQTNSLFPNRKWENHRQTINRLYGENRIRTFWRGGIFALCSVSTYGLKFYLYEEMKKYNIPSPIAAVGAKIVAGSITYPFDTLKKRMRTSTEKNPKMRDICISAWREGGIRTLWKGVSLYLLRAAPFYAILLPLTDFLMEKEWFIIKTQEKG